MARLMPQLRSDGRPAGEPLVWLTSMGLAVGLSMVGFLLWTIVSNGVAVFWPKHIQAWTITAGDSTELVWGMLAKQRERSDGKGGEIQVFTGNRDAFGAAFRYVPDSSIRSQETPAGLAVIERMEYGDALGMPARVLLANGHELPATSPDFRDQLDALIAEVSARRAELRRLERDVIGANSRRIANLEVAVARGKRLGDHPLVAESETGIAQLRKEYAEMAEQAAALRLQQEANILILRLSDGAERRISLGSVVAIAYPNELGLGGRISAMAAHFWTFLTENPREANTEGGIFPAIVGTFVMTLMMSIVVTPFGVLAAIYLREYARQGPFMRAVRISINNLAGVPSIVFGVFGLGFFVYGIGGNLDQLFFQDRLPNPTFGTGGVLWASATLALMTVPVVIVATEESISAVSRGAREGSLALGASKWQTIQRIVLPAAVPGILTGLILAMARGAGEVAPLMLVGVVKLAPGLPVDGVWNDTDLLPFLHLDQKFMHLGFHIYDLGFQSPDSDAAVPMVFATTFLLILLVVVLNLTAILMRERLRKRFATGAF